MDIASKDGPNGCINHAPDPSPNCVGCYRELQAHRDDLRAEVERLQDLVDRTTDAWLQADLKIAWEGGIDAAMRAAVAEIKWLRSLFA